jgi:hypothetical protein
MYEIEVIDMLSVRTDLIEVLKENTGLEVYYYMPPVSVAVSMPLLIVEEVDNNDYFYQLHEDNTETEIANVSYEISIYAVNPQDLFIFMPIIDRIMKRHGFKKTWTSDDSHVEPLYCKSMRFTGKIKLDNDVYYIYK